MEVVKEFPTSRDLPKKKVFYSLKKYRLFYLSILPFFLLFLLFGLIPIVSSFFMGFTNWSGLSDPEFIGLKNYIQLFKDPVFLKSIGNTLYVWLGSTVLTVGTAFVLAFLVHNYIDRGQIYFKTVFLFPLLVAPALTAIIISILFSPNSGMINSLISLLLGHQFTFNWLSSSLWIKPLIILLVLWRWTGWHFIILLAGLQTIPKELYEAARIDGAGGSQIFWRITFPLMIPVLLVSLTTATTGGIQIFDEPYVLTHGEGGTLSSGLTLGMNLYQTAFRDFNFGLASAMSYVIFALILLITLGFSFFMKKKQP